MELSREMLELVIKALDEKLGIEITAIDISEVSNIADYFVIVSGKSSSQVQALADNVLEKMARAGFDSRQVEGYDSARWILIDYRDVVIHIFDQEDRDFYNIERIWRDGKLIDIREFL